MKTTRGFTLVEILVAAGLILCGLVAAAAVFSVAIRVNDMNRRFSVATTLLHDKMEEFRSARSTDPIWTMPTGSETLLVRGETYTRSWEIDSNTPRTVTVIIYARRRAPPAGEAELLRATTLVASGF